MPITSSTVDRASWPFLKEWLRRYDRPLPESLLSKCHPLYCDLCAVKMNSADQARMHYSGKVHDKHAAHFLAARAAEQPGPTPRKMGEAKKAKVEVAQVSSDDLYCRVCELTFTSRQHAGQHFSGRNHMRKVNGLDPLKTGYYNKETKKWQRHPPARDVVAMDEVDGEIGSNLITVIDRPKKPRGKSRFFS